MIDCNKCENRGKINGLSQESFASLAYIAVQIGKKTTIYVKNTFRTYCIIARCFMLASLVQFKYIQTISTPNDTNFKVGLAGGHEVFGKPEQYNAFIDKYLSWLESR